MMINAAIAYTRTYSFEGPRDDSFTVRSLDLSLFRVVRYIYDIFNERETRVRP